METECSKPSFDFQHLAGRQITARFDGGAITSDAGALLLREVEETTGLLAEFAACFDDHRDPELIEHTVEDLLKQRVFALALGYEDLNDHDQLRADPLLAVLVGKSDPTGQDRVDPRDRGKPLAGKSTLNRLELTPVRANAGHRYKKIAARQRDIEDWFVEAFLTLNPTPPAEIVLDLDATDDPLHGHQLGRFFHGYYKSCLLAGIRGSILGRFASKMVKTSSFFGKMGFIRFLRTHHPKVPRRKGLTTGFFKA